MASASVVSTESVFPLIRLPRIRFNPLVCFTLFVACDAIAILLSGCLVVLGMVLLGTVLSGTVLSGGLVLGSPLLLGWHPVVQRLIAFWPTLGIFFSVFAYSNLYPGIIYNAVTELRRLSLSLTASFVMIAGILFIAGGKSSSGAALAFWWLAALIVVPLLRSALRAQVSCKPWWGIPVAVFYTGEESREMIQAMLSHPEIGLRPVVVLSSTRAVRTGHGLPVLDMGFAAAIRASGVRRAMIALPDAGSEKILEDLEKFESLFPHLMIMNGATERYSLTVGTCTFGGSLAVEVTRDLLLPFPRAAKRVMDLLIVSLALPGVSLLILLLAALVRLDSPGPVFYGHRRVGRSCSTFRAWKIRSMQVNADELLEKALAQSPALREEWLRDRKLRNDPRITRVGRFLRKTSLDELPQLWNVLCGEMSLVGPRPIVKEEVASYGLNFSLYCRVTPGLTGLWQVSGRNEVGVRDRVRLDSYYVRNWSPWLDLHILARTAKVVLTGQGAY